MLRRVVCLLSLGSILCAFSAPAPAQKVDDGRSAYFESATYRGLRGLRNSLSKGDTTFDPKEKDHKTAVAQMAGEYVYPLYWDAPESFKPGQLNKIVEDFAGRLSYLSREKDRLREKTAALQQMLCREVMDRCLEVTTKSPKLEETKKGSQALVGVNAAMMLSRIAERRLDRGAPQNEKEWSDEVLPRLAEGNGDHLIDVCLELLKLEAAKEGKKDGPNDGARYFTFRAMTNALSVPSKKEVVKKETEEKAVAAAMDFIAKSPKFHKKTPTAEKEGYKMLRREAIKVVAASRSPDLGEKGHPALVLAKFAVSDARIDPEPRLDERMEAAMGLCRMVSRAAKTPGFQADYAAWCVAHAVQAFAVAANLNLEKSGLERTRPWKVDAARLLEAVEQMKAHAKDAYVADALKQCNGVLAAIQAGNRAEAADLGAWLKKNPESKAISKDPEAVVKLPEAKGE